MTDRTVTRTVPSKILSAPYVIWYGTGNIRKITVNCTVVMLMSDVYSAVVGCFCLMSAIIFQRRQHERSFALDYGANWDAW